VDLRAALLHASIWRRRPEDWRAATPYLAMSYLYKRSNRFWHCSSSMTWYTACGGLPLPRRIGTRLFCLALTPRFRPKGRGGHPEAKSTPPGNVMAAACSTNDPGWPLNTKEHFQHCFPKAQRRGRENWPRFALLTTMGTSAGQPQVVRSEEQSSISQLRAGLSWLPG